MLSPFLEVIATLAREYPSSLNSAHKTLGIKRDVFVKYVVCPDDSCCALYTCDEAIEKRGTRQTIKTCTKPKGRGVCGQMLLRKVTLQGDKITFYPFKTYCYFSLQKAVS